MRFEFIIEGKPRGKGRPRRSQSFGSVRMHTDSKTISYEKKVVYAFRRANGRILVEGKKPLRVSIKAVFIKPKGWTKKKKAETIYYTSVPDCDNIAKIVCDGLNGVAYEDDSQVARIDVCKVYGAKECVEVIITDIV